LKRIKSLQFNLRLADRILTLGHARKSSPEQGRRDAGFELI